MKYTVLCINSEGQVCTVVPDDQGWSQPFDRKEDAEAIRTAMEGIHGKAGCRYLLVEIPVQLPTPETV